MLKSHQGADDHTYQNPPEIEYEEFELLSTYSTPGEYLMWLNERGERGWILCEHPDHFTDSRIFYRPCPVRVA